MKTLLLLLLASALTTGLTSCYDPYYGHGPGYCPPPIRPYHQHYDHSCAPRHYYRGYRGCR